MSKGSQRRPEDTKAIEKNWPFKRSMGTLKVTITQDMVDQVAERERRLGEKWDEIMGHTVGRQPHTCERTQKNSQELELNREDSPLTA